MLRVERIGAFQGPLLKALRCRALAEAPSAFGSTLEEARQRSDESWATQAQECAQGWTRAMFIAYWNDQPCGLMGCLIEGELGEIATLFSVWVAPEHRRLKVAHQMVEEVKLWARENGAQALHAWVTEKNTGAIHFYKSVAMQEVGQREIVRPDSLEEQILFVGSLSSC